VREAAVGERLPDLVHRVASDDGPLAAIIFEHADRTLAKDGGRNANALD
jgi:hypothetical protein